MHEFRPLLIAVLVVTEVAIWQWRMVIAHRGRRSTAMFLGFVGATLQITAISQVVADIHDVLSIVAYAGGVGCGVLFGIVAGERLTPGRLEVTSVSGLPTFAESLWQRGWAATALSSESAHGPVTTVHVDVDRRHATQLHEDIHGIDPFARWVAKEIRESGVNMHQHPAVMKAVMDGRSRDLAAAADRHRLLAASLSDPRTGLRARLCAGIRLMLPGHAGCSPDPGARRTNVARAATESSGP